jgi:hypothetical protein
MGSAKTPEDVSTNFSLEMSAHGFSATISAISEAIRWAEQIMNEIDRRWPGIENGNSAGSSARLAIGIG